MIDFDFGKYLQKISPHNIATKATAYSVGGVPLITYGFIGVTAVLLGTVHMLDKEEGNGEKKEE